MSDQTTHDTREPTTRVHPPVGVHHPVRSDRADGDRHLGHPRRRVRASTRRRADPRHLPGGRGDPQRILVDSLTAPINGLYGIEDAKGNISYYNSGTLFGAIDVALFIIVIGGFLGVTMRTGAIQAGIAGSSRGCGAENGG